jgi:hypothetical protein
MLNAGWMSVLREDIGDQTFWRVFIRVQKQDGSQGVPLKDPPWDLNTRYQLDPRAYEAGGSYTPVPSGYWLDLTSLAEAYGWHRLAALPGWRTYYSAARFSEFAYTGGLDWYSAMLELYPAEALYTATPVLPPTITPSRTPRPTSTPTSTWTPRATFTPARPKPCPTPVPLSNTPPLHLSDYHPNLSSRRHESAFPGVAVRWLRHLGALPYQHAAPRGQRATRFAGPGGRAVR